MSLLPDGLQVDGLEAKAGSFRLQGSFSLPPGGITVVFGPSGAGKSMLLKTLAGLVRPTAGRIVLDGRVLDDAGARTHVAAHRRGVGLLFQDARLFPHLTVEGNLSYARRRAAGSVGPGIPGIADLLGISDLMPRPVRNLSGGEKSRVALARALSGAPRLLMLDEPFAALDGRRRRTFLALLRRINRELSLPMIVVTHLVEDAIELADNLVLVRAGQTIDSGAAEPVAAGERFGSLLDPRDAGTRLETSALSGGGALPDARAAWIRADTVLLATERPVGLSARNVWPGVVGDLVEEPDGALLASVNTPAGRLLSRITPEACQDLQLEPGREVWAIVKTHSL